MTSSSRPRHSHVSAARPLQSRKQKFHVVCACRSLVLRGMQGLLLRFRVFGPTSSEFPASDSLSSIQNEGEDRFLRRSSATCRRRSTRFGLGFVSLLLSLLSGMALRAQNPPAEQKPSSPPGAQSSTEKTPAPPSEKGKEQNPQAKPSPTPPAAPPQKLQL